MEARAAALRSAFAAQARACQSLGSPFMHQLCNLLADRLDLSTAVGRAVLQWPGDPSSSADSVPLRLAGALHALVLSGRSPALAQAYPPHSADDAFLWSAIGGAFDEQKAFILEFLESAPQTNEVRRSAAVMCGLAAVTARYGLPVEILELGASAGLNLVPDLYRHRLGETQAGDAGSKVELAPEWRGRPAPRGDVRVVARAGCDLRPFDLQDPTALQRMRAYLWADQPDRMERTVAAWEIARAALARKGVARADAAAWLEARLASPHEGRTRVVFHTIAWQYFPAGVQAQCLAALEHAGSVATPHSPLVRFAMEADGGNGAALTLTMWPGGEATTFGRADFHGRWIELV